MFSETNFAISENYSDLDWTEIIFILKLSINNKTDNRSGGNLYNKFIL